MRLRERFGGLGVAMWSAFDLHCEVVYEGRAGGWIRMI